MRATSVLFFLAGIIIRDVTAMPKPYEIIGALLERQAQAADGEQIDQQEVAIPAFQDAGDVNTRMIGDLRQGATTPVGKSIQNILLRVESAEASNSRYNPPGPPGSQACARDTCCIWSHVSAAMTKAFKGSGGRCNDMARAAVRLGFHDAGTWSSSLAARNQDFGGADGSIILSGSEIGRLENRGLQDISQQMIIWQKQFSVSMADLIQYGSIHAVVTCPLGPRIRAFVGRKDSSTPAPDGLLPAVNASADSLIDLFEDKTISGHELAALVGAHSASKQFFVDGSRAGDAQDGTPGVWDVRFYNQTQETTGVPKKVFRFQSDVVLSEHPSLQNEWAKFRLPDGVGQRHWNEDYATAYTRLSLLGVNNINKLTECSKTLPPARPDFQSDIDFRSF